MTAHAMSLVKLGGSGCLRPWEPCVRRTWVPCSAVHCRASDSGHGCGCPAAGGARGKSRRPGAGRTLDRGPDRGAGRYRGADPARAPLPYCNALLARRRYSPRMRALVTGASGFVGAAVVRALLGAHWQVRALVRRHSNRSNLNRLDVELAEGDLTDFDSLLR